MNSNHCETTTHCESEKETDCENMPEKLLCLANEAWREVVKEKIKAHIEATSGAKLDQLAKVIAETNQQKWQLFGSGKKLRHEFTEKLKAVFS